MAEVISIRNAADASVEYMKLFGSNKNIGRVTPSFQDGMKPGKRRLFWSWWESIGKPESVKAAKKQRYLKVGDVAGHSMKYHPHSTAATEKLIGREGQAWNNNVMTIDPKGGYGSLNGIAPASGRYIEAKISDYTIDCFFDDFSKYAVPMKPSYDGGSMEPEYLPAKYPHLLFNPQFSGIGYGDSSNIPPFNVTEVLRACIKLIKNPDAKIRLIPDIPTGCDVVDNGEFDAINKTGLGKVLMRASYNIDYQKNRINITSIPYTIATRDIVSKLTELKDAKKLDMIDEVSDYTRDGNVDLRIMVKHDENPEKVMQMLFKKTDLEYTLPVSISVVDDYATYDYGVKDYLLAWLEFRRNLLISRYNKEYQMVEERIHILEVLIDITKGDRGEEIVKAIQKAKNTDDAVEKLMKMSKASSVQARAIVNMSLSRFTKKAHDEYIEEMDELTHKAIVEILNYLENPEALDNLMIAQFEIGINKYGGPRRSKIVSDNEPIDERGHLVGVSENGYVKKLDIKCSSIGQIGKSYDPMTVLDALSTDTITLFTANGNMQSILVDDLPDMEPQGIGVELKKVSNLSGKVVSVLKNMPKDNNHHIIILTKFGIAKRLETSELNSSENSSRNVKSFITLNPGDEVVSVIYDMSKGKSNLIIYTNEGNGIRIPTSDIHIYARAAKGTRQISLRNDEVVSGASIINTKKKFLFYITSAGKCKITELKSFPQMQRGSDPAHLINMDPREFLVGICSANPGDVVLGFKRTGEPTEIAVNDLEVTSRMAKGKKVIKTPKGDFVVGYKLFEA